MTSQAGMDEYLAQVMNTYVAGKYSTVPFNDGPDTDSGLFFRPEKWTFVSATYIPTSLRDIAQYVLRHAGSGQELYIYSVHLKASSGSANELQRLAEATILRDHLNALPAGTNFMIVGDYNFYGGLEPAYVRLTETEADDDGRAFDPLNLGGIATWNNSLYRAFHTQSTRLAAFDGGATGGLDDRFDIALTSSSLAGRTIHYTAYGNDGNHYNDSISHQPNAAVPDSIARALYLSSDHIPVYVDLVFPHSQLSVQFTSFTGTYDPVNRDVDLLWSTGSETNNFGFRVERGDSPGGPFIDLPGSAVSGAGTTLVPQSYAYHDSAVVPGTWYYRLRQIDLDGTSRTTDPVRVDIVTSVTETAPFGFGLSQNYPNPFNPDTRFEFSLPRFGKTTLAVYDILGREIDVLVDDVRPAGTYRVTWTPSNLPSGVYVVRLQAGAYTAVRLAVLLK